MPCWTSPWPVAAALDSHLRAAGLVRCQDPLEAWPADALIVYSPPDVLLAAGMASSPDPPLAQQWATTYRQLQSLYGRHRLIATWRLQALAPEAIRGWLEDGSPLHVPLAFPEPEPLCALVARALMDRQPQLLEAYLDLELIAELAGGEPDTAYLQRLSTAVADSGTLLESCWRPHQRQQALLQDKVAQLAREDALAIESQQAREAEARLRGQLERARDAQEKQSRAQRVRDVRLRQLEETVVSLATRSLRLQADLLQVRDEKEETRRKRDGLRQELHGLALEREEALAAVAAVHRRIAARDAELERARDAEAQLLAQVEALETEKQQALEGAEEREQRLRDLLDDHERLARRQQAGEARLQQREETVASQEARILRLEADLLQISGEREEALTALAALNEQMAERQAELGRARDAEVQLLAQVEAQEMEKQRALEAAEERWRRLHVALEDHERLFLETRGQRDHIALLETRLAGLGADLEQARSALLAEQTRIAAHEQEARQARDAEVRVLDRVGRLERENQRIREESEALRVEVHHLLDDQNRHALAVQRHAARVAQLEETISAQVTRIAGLEAEGERFKGERDLARLQREETLRLARSTEADLQAKVQALDVKAGRASEETGRLMAQIHHLHEELEQTFLHGQAGDQLIAAQHQQLQRAQSLMSRLLVQATQSLIPAQAVSVEVLPTPTVQSIPGSSASGDPNRQRGGGRLLRRFWTP